MFKNMIDKKRTNKGLYWQIGLTLIDGCTQKSEGCQNCWSASISHRFKKGLTDKNGNWIGEIRLNHHLLDRPLKRKKPTVYSIWNDLFHEDVPFEFIEKVRNIAILYPQHTILILTKRPKRIYDFWQYMLGKYLMYAPLFPDNVWLGVTVENPKEDWRIGELLKIPGKNKFISIEPALDYVRIEKYAQWLNWIIYGCESGKNRRTIGLREKYYLESLKITCNKYNIPLWIKQININGKLVRDINKFPEDLRERNLPQIGTF